MERYPLTWQDQSVLDLEGASDPWNIQLEIASAEPIDVVRLADAVVSAAGRHPLMHSRLERGKGMSATNHWVPEPLDAIPVDVRECSDAGVLDRLRTTFYSPAFDLRVGPPFKVMVARTPDSDIVMFNVAHPIVDGIGLLRFLRSVTAVYRGEDDPADPLPLAEARDLRQHLRPGSVKEAGGRLLEGARKLEGALNPPARVAQQSEDERNVAGFAHRVLHADAVAALNGLRPPGTTLNDVILAAVSLTVERWNTERGSEADKVQLFMPVSVRPAEWSTEIVSNLFSYVSVATLAEERGDLAATTEAVATHTAPIRRTARAGGTQDLLRLIAPLPARVKRQMPHLLTATGNRFVDTAVVSNLGRPAHLPSFGDGPPPAVQFSPPYWSAASVSVGAISAGGRLHLGVRHRMKDLDADAGAAFADLLVEVLTK